MNENARYLLKGYALSKARIATLSDELGRYTSVLNATRIAASKIEDNKKLQTAVDATARIVDSLTEEIHMDVKRCDLAIAAISSLDNTEMRTVLEFHYLSGMTLREISQKLYCCLTTVKKLHRRGLEMVEAYLKMHHTSGNG